MFLQIKILLQNPLRCPLNTVFWSFVLIWVHLRFTPLQTYKVLKPKTWCGWLTWLFTPLQTYKDLKPCRYWLCRSSGFTPLQTYKVLKPLIGLQIHHHSFTPLQTYKVLKQNILNAFPIIVLHHYKLTRFSNREIERWIQFMLWFYTITNLQGSQTMFSASRADKKFYTITNLQGSQTNITTELWQA